MKHLVVTLGKLVKLYLSLTLYGIAAVAKSGRLPSSSGTVPRNHSWPPRAVLQESDLLLILDEWSDARGASGCSGRR